MREPITNSEIARGYQWCIAGGFAALPDKAGDCDVWVYGVSYESLSSARDKILERLRARNIVFTEEPVVWGEVEESYATGVNIGSLKVARLADNRHIVVTKAQSIDDILNAFDVSTHQVALSSDGELIRGREFTPISVEPIMLLQNDKTEGRMQKVEQRYGVYR